MREAMEIESVRNRRKFVSTETSWESIIKDKQRTTKPASSIDDPVERNKKMQEKRWRKKNPEKCKEATKRWKQKNKEHVRLVEKAWRDSNPDKIKLYQERNKKNIKAWAEAHRDRIRELNRVNDAKRRNTKRRINWTKEYRQRPEVKERIREADRKRAASPERKDYEHERSKRRWAEKKTSALYILLCNIGPLDNFIDKGDERNESV